MAKRTVCDDLELLAKLQGSPEAQAFYSAIREEPEDDARSLIFADWLEERGAPSWAELIRVQIALALIPKWETPPKELTAREKQLLKVCKKALKPPEVIGVEWGKLEKGLVRSMTGWIHEDLPRHIKMVAGLAPISRWVCSSQPRARILDKIPNDPQSIAGQLRELDVSPAGLTGMEWESVVEKFPFPCLRSLNMGENIIGAKGVKAIAQNPKFALLRSLNVQACKIGISGFKAIFGSEILTHLETLNLRYNEITPTLLSWLTNETCQLKSLKSLDLSANPIGRDGMEALLHSPVMTNLQELTIRSAELDDSCIDALIKSQHLNNITYLDLSFNSISCEALCKLLSSPSLASLRSLTQIDIEIDNKLIDVLANSPALENLKLLTIGEPDIFEKNLVARLEERFGPGLISKGELTKYIPDCHHWQRY